MLWQFVMSQLQFTLYLFYILNKNLVRINISSQSQFLYILNSAQMGLLFCSVKRALIGLKSIMPTIIIGKMEMEFPLIHIISRFIGSCFMGPSAISQDFCQIKHFTKTVFLNRVQQPLLVPQCNNVHLTGRELSHWVDLVIHWYNN